MAVQFTPGGLYMILTSDDSVFTGTVNSADDTTVTMQLSDDSDPFSAGDQITIFLNQIIAMMVTPPET